MLLPVLAAVYDIVFFNFPVMDGEIEVSSGNERGLSEFIQGVDTACIRMKVFFLMI